MGKKSPSKVSIYTGLAFTIFFPIFAYLSPSSDSSCISYSFSTYCSSNTKTQFFRSFCMMKLIINIKLFFDITINSQQTMFAQKMGYFLCMILCQQALQFEGFIINKHIFMLNKNDSKEGLLQNDSEMNSSAIDNRVETKNTKSKIRRDKAERSEVTYILKILNLVVGGSFLAFSVFCYMYGFEQEDLQQNAIILRYVMPAYIGISGVIIIAIECRIGLVVRNMRFFYNYFGRGIFNVYAGVMPLTLISNFQDSLSTFEIVTLVASSVMTLVGVLYICLKIFCCEKEGDKIDQANKSEDSD